MDQISLLLLLKSLKRDHKNLLDLLMLRDQEDSGQKEPVTSDKHSLWENKTMLESMLSEENLKKEIRLSTKPQRSKDLLLKRESEERFLLKHWKNQPGNQARKLIKLMKNFFPNIWKKRKLKKHLLKPQLHQLLQLKLLPQPRLPQLKMPQQKLPLLQLRLLLQPSKLLPQ